jgi:CRISPR-associated protein Cas2
VSGARPYLLAYDIADPRRLARIARLVSRVALRIQYSVYVAELTLPQLRELVAILRDAIDPKADDLRIYPLPKRIDAVWYGRATWPDGVQFEGPGWLGLTPISPKATLPKSAVTPKTRA